MIMMNECNDPIKRSLLLIKDESEIKSKNIWMIMINECSDPMKRSLLFIRDESEIKSEKILWWLKDNDKWM